MGDGVHMDAYEGLVLRVLWRYSLRRDPSWYIEGSMSTIMPLSYFYPACLPAGCSTSLAVACGIKQAMGGSASEAQLSCSTVSCPSFCIPPTPYLPARCTSSLRITCTPPTLGETRSSAWSLTWRPGTSGSPCCQLAGCCRSGAR